MGLLAKAKASSSDKGMGFLLVFFPEDNSAITDKTKLFPSASSSSKSPNNSFRRTNSRPLLSKAQSTISICVLLVFVTLLLFTLSSFEPAINTPPVLPQTSHRRLLVQKHPTVHIPSNSNSIPKTRSPKLWRAEPYNANKNENFPSTALQRMGTLYRRGTRAMADLVVGHVDEETTDDEFRLFLRVIHRSGLTARADIVFIFSSASSSSRFASIIQQENDKFFSLIEHHTELNMTHQKPESNFDVTRFFKVGKKGTKIAEPLWGKKIRTNFSNSETENGMELTVLSYGSVLSFDATELDPENSLTGFLDRVPMSLRRWACYTMLLGRVRKNFKHVMLVDVKNSIVMNDPLGRVRNWSPDSVLVYAKPENKQGKRNSDRTQSRRVNSGVVMGGARGVRRFSNAVLIEIVRAAMQQQKKKKSSVSESAVLSQLVGNKFVLKSKNVDLISSGESIPEASSLGGKNYVIIQRGMNNYEINSVIKKRICSSVLDSSVYRDC